MSFNGSGVFSINTAGQPVVTGTTITSTAFNAFTADIATGLSTCMLKDGTQTATAAIGFYAGTVSLPGIYFGTDTATGLYRIGLNNTGYSINGTKLLDLSAAAFAVTGTISATSTISATTSLLTPSTTFNLVNTTATTVNFAGAATTLNIGNSGGTNTVLGATTFSQAVTHSSTTTLSAALTYGGVTLSNAVTGTGNMVLSVSPTLTGTVSTAAISASKTVSAATGADAARALYVEGYPSGIETSLFYRDNTDDQTAIKIRHDRATGTDAAKMILFVDQSNTTNGSITTTGTATAYNTSSDRRLKNITGDLTNSGEFIDALQPRVGTWKADGSPFVGFVADEVQTVSPRSVVGEPDAVDEDGNPSYQAMEYGSAEFIANIVAELKSVRTRLAALEAR